MPLPTREIAYFEARLAETARRAEGAAVRCARVAHLGLAKLYRTRIAELRSDGPSPVEDCARAMQNAPYGRGRTAG